MNDFVAAMFADEFAEGKADRDGVDRISRGDFGEWVLALERSGLFFNRTVERLVDSWAANPKSLFDVLLAGADEVTVRRYDLLCA